MYVLEFPMGQVPLLIVDGHRMSQSASILRFVAERFGLGGKDEFERARAAEIYGVFYDRALEHFNYHMFLLKNPGQDDEILYKKHFVPAVEKAIPFYEQAVKEANEHGGFVLKSGLSYGDFVIAEHLTSLFYIEPKLKRQHPKLAAFAENVYSVSPAIKEYVANRPKILV
ncbi:Glutathione S-transferase S3 [Aphelenchoides besseyi]|nr:Glutathione S-transferase S3 [Aphelenchoides besseyi]KAI6219639.1 Glutathione-S-transferase [Aphelenchoides besseyi]